MSSAESYEGLHNQESLHLKRCARSCTTATTTPVISLVGLAYNALLQQPSVADVPLLDATTRNQRSGLPARLNRGHMVVALTVLMLPGLFCPGSVCTSLPSSPTRGREG